MGALVIPTFVIGTLVIFVMGAFVMGAFVIGAFPMGAFTIGAVRVTFSSRLLRPCLRDGRLCNRRLVMALVMGR